MSTISSSCVSPLHSLSMILIILRHVWKSQCEFLSTIINHVGSTDGNHNIKSERGQWIGGGGNLACSIGNFMVDPEILRLAGCSMVSLRPADFASDVLARSSFSCKNMSLVLESDPGFGSTVEGDKMANVLQMLFMNLQNHAINSKTCPAKHRIVYIWAGMIFLTSGEFMILLFQLALLQHVHLLFWTKSMAHRLLPSATLLIMPLRPSSIQPMVTLKKIATIRQNLLNTFSVTVVPRTQLPASSL